MSRYKPYPKYKESGVEWLGEVPEKWDVVPARNIVDNLVAKNENVKDQRYLSLMANVGVIKHEDKGDIGNKKPEDLSKCKIVRKGNLVINSMNYSIGSFGMSPYDGVCSPVYVVLGIKEDIVVPQFALRLFENKSFQQYAASFGNGILAHRAAIGWDELKGAYLPLPSLNEQTAIANFLDRETAKIDTLIGKQERLIELLQEKRQALISHAVTKGLDPNVKMKESGVAWLGEVPEHWEEYRIDWIGTIVRGNTGFKKDELLDKGDFVALQYGKTYKVDEIDKSFNFYVNSEFYKYNQVVHQGDTILISTSETIEDLGHSCFYNREELGLIGGEQILLKPNNQYISGKYLVNPEKPNPTTDHPSQPPPILPQPVKHQIEPGIFSSLFRLDAYKKS